MVLFLQFSPTTRLIYCHWLIVVSGPHANGLLPVSAKRSQAIRYTLLNCTLCDSHRFKYFVNKNARNMIVSISIAFAEIAYVLIIRIRSRMRSAPDGTERDREDCSASAATIKANVIASPLNFSSE